MMAPVQYTYQKHHGSGVPEPNSLSLHTNNLPSRIKNNHLPDNDDEDDNLPLSALTSATINDNGNNNGLPDYSRPNAYAPAMLQQQQQNYIPTTASSITMANMTTPTATQIPMSMSNNNDYFSQPTTLSRPNEASVSIGGGNMAPTPSMGMGYINNGAAAGYSSPRGGLPNQAYGQYPHNIYSQQQHPPTSLALPPFNNSYKYQDLTPSPSFSQNQIPNNSDIAGSVGGGGAYFSPQYQYQQMNPQYYNHVGGNGGGFSNHYNYQQNQQYPNTTTDTPFHYAHDASMMSNDITNGYYSYASSDAHSSDADIPLATVRVPQSNNNNQNNATTTTTKADSKRSSFQNNSGGSKFYCNEYSQSYLETGIDAGALSEGFSDGQSDTPVNCVPVDNSSTPLDVTDSRVPEIHHQEHHHNQQGINMPSDEDSDDMPLQTAIKDVSTKENSGSTPFLRREVSRGILHQVHNRSSSSSSSNNNADTTISNEPESSPEQVVPDKPSEPLVSHHHVLTTNKNDPATDCDVDADDEDEIVDIDSQLKFARRLSSPHPHVDATTASSITTSSNSDHHGNFNKNPKTGKKHALSQYLRRQVLTTNTTTAAQSDSFDGATSSSSSFKGATANQGSSFMSNSSGNMNVSSESWEISPYDDALPLQNNNNTVAPFRQARPPTPHTRPVTPPSQKPAKTHVGSSPFSRDRNGTISRHSSMKVTSDRHRDVRPPNVENDSFYCNAVDAADDDGFDNSSLKGRSLAHAKSMQDIRGKSMNNSPAVHLKTNSSFKQSDTGESEEEEPLALVQARITMANQPLPTANGNSASKSINLAQGKIKRTDSFMKMKMPDLPKDEDYYSSSTDNSLSDVESILPKKEHKSHNHLVESTSSLSLNLASVKANHFKAMHDAFDKKDPLVNLATTSSPLNTHNSNDKRDEEASELYVDSNVAISRRRSYSRNGSFSNISDSASSIQYSGSPSTFATVSTTNNSPDVFLNQEGSGGQGNFGRNDATTTSSSTSRRRLTQRRGRHNHLQQVPTPETTDNDNAINYGSSPHYPNDRFSDMNNHTEIATQNFSLSNNLMPGAFVNAVPTSGARPRRQRQWPGGVKPSNTRGLKFIEDDDDKPLSLLDRQAAATTAEASKAQGPEKQCSEESSPSQANPVSVVDALDYSPDTHKVIKDNANWVKGSFAPAVQLSMTNDMLGSGPSIKENPGSQKPYKLQQKMQQNDGGSGSNSLVRHHKSHSQLQHRNYQSFDSSIYATSQDDNGESANEYDDGGSSSAFEDSPSQNFESLSANNLVSSENARQISRSQAAQVNISGANTPASLSNQHESSVYSNSPDGVHHRNSVSRSTTTVSRKQSLSKKLLSRSNTTSGSKKPATTPPAGGDESSYYASGSNVADSYATSSTADSAVAGSESPNTANIHKSLLKLSFWKSAKQKSSESGSYPSNDMTAGAGYTESGSGNIQPNTTYSTNTTTTSADTSKAVSRSTSINNRSRSRSIRLSRNNSQSTKSYNGSNSSGYHAEESSYDQYGPMPENAESAVASATAAYQNIIDSISPDDYYNVDQLIADVDSYLMGVPGAAQRISRILLRKQMSPSIDPSTVPKENEKSKSKDSSPESDRSPNRDGDASDEDDDETPLGMTRTSPKGNSSQKQQQKEQKNKPTMDFLPTFSESKEDDMMISMLMPNSVLRSNKSTNSIDSALCSYRSRGYSDASGDYDRDLNNRTDINNDDEDDDNKIIDLSKTNLRQKRRQQRQYSNQHRSQTSKSSSSINALTEDQKAIMVEKEKKEQERIHKEKVRVALEKLKVADLKKVSIRIFVADAKRYFTFFVSTFTTVDMFLQEMKDQKVIDPMLADWGLFELVDRFKVERVMNGWENVTDVVGSWEQNSNNYLVVKHQKQISDMALINPAEAAIEDLEALNDFMNSRTTKGLLHYRVKKSKWRERMFEISGNSLMFVKDGGRSSRKKLDPFISLENHAVYAPTELVKGSHSKFVIALKSELPLSFFEKPEEDYIKYLCAKSSEQYEQWVRALHAAKHRIKVQNAVDEAEAERLRNEPPRLPTPHGSRPPSRASGAVNGLGIITESIAAPSSKDYTAAASNSQSTGLSRATSKSKAPHPSYATANSNGTPHRPRAKSNSMKPSSSQESANEKDFASSLINALQTIKYKGDDDVEEDKGRNRGFGRNRKGASNTVKESTASASKPRRRHRSSTTTDNSPYVNHTSNRGDTGNSNSNEVSPSQGKGFSGYLLPQLSGKSLKKKPNKLIADHRRNRSTSSIKDEKIGSDDMTDDLKPTKAITRKLVRGTFAPGSLLAKVEANPPPPPPNPDEDPSKLRPVFTSDMFKKGSLLDRQEREREEKKPGVAGMITYTSRTAMINSSGGGSGESNAPAFTSGSLLQKSELNGHGSLARRKHSSRPNLKVSAMSYSNNSSNNGSRQHSGGQIYNSESLGRSFGNGMMKHQQHISTTPDASGLNSSAFHQQYYNGNFKAGANNSQYPYINAHMTPSSSGQGSSSGHNNNYRGSKSTHTSPVNAKFSFANHPPQPQLPAGIATSGTANPSYPLVKGNTQFVGNPGSLIAQRASKHPQPHKPSQPTNYYMPFDQRGNVVSSSPQSHRNSNIRRHATTKH
ncbi:hypothetical protein H4219_005528 [Mycoemilia scoparia]|uniref:PH domain-containing protein n=1 Tax=Mycoemilia scoparia TaxID=417184 RepID=A0A9W7ZTA6_9FUNG|nr:hypothetical protein H4219_005528 [Mycoemilia scoparia]